MIDESVLKKGLHTRWVGRKIYTFDTIDSTNNCARALAGCFAEEGTVVIADHQSAGRGRLGRSWDSPASENLMFSVILRPTLSPDATNLLPLVTAVAVASAIEESTGLKADCKWPNDLLLGGKKVAGILLEGSLKQNAVEFVVIGIGVNVNQVVFPTELAPRATSLRLAGGREVDRVRLFQSILRSIEHLHARLAPSHFKGVLPLWLARSRMINRQISVSQQGSVLSGVVRGLSDDGGLILNSSGTQHTLFAGDVTLLDS